MSQFDLDRRTVMLLVGVLIAAVAATLFFTRQPVQVEPVAAPMVPMVTSSPSEPAAPQVSSSPVGEVVVEVVGKVRDPQVLTLPKGSRVIDALEAAGGPRAGVDTSNQNLARVLVDGEQIRVGLELAPAPGPTASSAAGSSGTPVDINTATAEGLEAIPGVGPVLAQRIIAYRDQNGGFTSIDQLLEVSGIGEATFAQMQSMVTVSGG